MESNLLNQPLRLPDGSVLRNRLSHTPPARTRLRARPGYSRLGAPQVKRSSMPRTKGAAHERIVNAGARAIRRDGYDALSIASVMKEADLTHGGFYAHFASREAMLVGLSYRAGAQAVAVFSQIAAAAPAETALQALLRTYLSETHVNQPDIGCPIAALGTEMPRQAPPVRRA